MSGGNPTVADQPAAAPAAEYSHDVFVSHSGEDAAWVMDELLPQLEAAGLRVMIADRDFQAGVPILDNIEQAIECCARTIVVLSPAWVEGQWTGFESLLAGTRDVENRTRKLLPIVLKECQPRGRIAVLHSISFVNPPRRVEAMARLLKQLGKTQQALNEAVTHSARRGLGALIELMRQPQVRGALQFIEDDFEEAGRQIELLSQYKRLHDLFQRAEGAFNLVLQEKRLLLKEVGSWDDLESPALKLDAELQSLLSFARGNGFPRSETLWAPKLERAQQDLLAAIRDQAMGAFDSAAERLNAVIGQVPYRLNNWLVKIAERIPLDRLMKQLRIVSHSLSDWCFDGAAANYLADFKQGLDALGKLVQSLDCFIITHNCLQEIDNELRRHDQSSKLDIEEVHQTWKDLQVMMAPLSDTSGNDWIVQLRALGADLDAALARRDAPKSVSSLFRSFCSTATRGFNQVDQDLLTFCGQLQKVGETLARGLRRMQHE
jgi:hypothetical protein